MACEQEVSFESEAKPDIVVNAVLSTDRALQAHLTYSKSIFDSGAFEAVDDAQVIIKDLTDEIDYICEHRGKGQYMSDGNLGIAGHQYQLRVLAADLQQLEALSYVPQNFEVDVKAIERVDDGSNSAVRIDFDIIEEVQSDNYYVWDIIAPQSVNVPNSINEQYSDWLAGQDVHTDGNRYRPHWKVFHEDTDISSSVVESSIIAIDSIPAAGVTVDTGNPTPSDTISSQPSMVALPIRLRVQAVSKHLYEYYQNLDTYTRNGGLNSSYNSPVELYSNVSGGMGIFAGYNEKVLAVK